MNRSAIALVAGLLLCLTGCGKAADPPAAPVPTVSVSPTASGPAEPVRPAASYQLTKAGAVAFGKYFLAVVDYAQESGDTSQLRGLQQDDCSACTAGRRWIESVIRRGGKIEGGTHRVRHAAALFFNGKGAGLTMTVVTSPQQVTGAGHLNRRYGGGRQVLTMAVNAVHNEWRVADMKFF